MPSLSVVRAFNAAKTFNYHPVAVFVGGTSGIGRGMAEAFARHTQGKSSIYLVGRNETAARTVLDALPKPSDGDPDSASSKSATYKREFIKCDATLMKNVHAAAKDILSKEEKINYLVLSPGIMTMQGFTPTEEGIDQKLAVHYYARWRFIYDLIPAIDRATEAGEEGVVVSVLAAGKGGAIDVENLGLEKNYSVATAGLITPTYNDLMLESFSALHPKATFVQTYPGIVRTSLMSRSNSTLLNAMAPLMNTLLYPVTTGIEETGEYMMYGAYNAKVGTANRVGSRGEDIGKKRYFGTDEERQKLWDHTVEKTKVVG